MDLTDPWPLRHRTAPSRVVFGPHETNLGDGRAISARHVAYYERRAAGGAGVVVVEEASVHPSDWPYERSPLAAECGPGWGAVVDACRPHGTVVLAALGHAGGQGSSAYSQRPLWAPSRVPEVNTREVPKWMEPADVDAVVDGFATAAAAAVAAGCDGVEVNAGQHSLVRQFLSGLTNLRDDEWGRDRLAFARAVLAAVRDAVGADALVGLRLSCDELAPWAGIVPEAAAEIAAELVGPVDLLSVVRGSIYSAAATRPDGHTPPGFNLDLAASVRDAVRARHGERVAVVAQGSLVDVDMVRWAIGEGGRADAVEMTRALLADADLVAKVRAGASEQVRPCILCNQTCQVRDARNPIVSCVADPRTGHETTEPDPSARRSPTPVAVTVVGGGVAGLEAARVAAAAGHTVRVVERRPVTGGVLPTAAAGTGRDRLARLAGWLDAECRRLGVDIATGTDIEPSDLAGDGPVVVATGGRPAPPSFRVTAAACVVDAATVLADLGGHRTADPDGGAALPDGPVVVWDPMGGPVGVSVAETLAAAGRSVTVITPDNIVGNELSRSGDLAPANARLQQAGVTLVRRAILRVARKGGAEIEDRYSGARTTVAAAAVVDAGHRLPDDALFGALSAGAAHRLVVRAGDCVAPRTVAEAVLEGRRAAMALDGLGRISDGVPLHPATH